MQGAKNLELNVFFFFFQKKKQKNSILQQKKKKKKRLRQIGSFLLLW